LFSFFLFCNNRGLQGEPCPFFPFLPGLETFEPPGPISHAIFFLTGLYLSLRFRGGRALCQPARSLSAVACFLFSSLYPRFSFLVVDNDFLGTPYEGEPVDGWPLGLSCIFETFFSSPSVPNPSPSFFLHPALTSLFFFSLDTWWPIALSRIALFFSSPWPTRFRKDFGFPSSGPLFSPHFFPPPLSDPLKTPLSFRRPRPIDGLVFSTRPSDGLSFFTPDERGRNVVRIPVLSPLYPPAALSILHTSCLV